MLAFVLMHILLCLQKHTLANRVEPDQRAQSVSLSSNSALFRMEKSKFIQNSLNILEEKNPIL